MQASFNTIWDLADVLMGFMAIINIVVILLLGKIAFKCLKDYSIQKNEGKDPIFHPDNLGIKKTLNFGMIIEKKYEKPVVKYDPQQSFYLSKFASNSFIRVLILINFFELF